jgi:hypothetical protein
MKKVHLAERKKKKKNCFYCGKVYSASSLTNHVNAIQQSAAYLNVTATSILNRNCKNTLTRGTKRQKSKRKSTALTVVTKQMTGHVSLSISTSCTALQN